MMLIAFINFFSKGTQKFNKEFDDVIDEDGISVHIINTTTMTPLWLIFSTLKLIAMPFVWQLKFMVKSMYFFKDKEKDGIEILNQ